MAVTISSMPYGREGEKVRLDQPRRETQKDLTFAVETLARDHIGFIGLHRIDWRNGVATSGTLIGRRDLWGQGYGSDAARVRSRHAFEVLGLRMLLSDVMADN